jgi:hypothetical protein
MSFKKLIQFVFTLLFLVSVQHSVLAQNFQNKIHASFSSGSIKDLSKNFDKRVQVTISNKSEFYSNSQAEIIISDYLNQLGSKNFTVIRTGITEGGSAEFVIGEVKSVTKGIVKVYIYARKVADTPYIQEIRFE